MNVTCAERIKNGTEMRDSGSLLLLYLAVLYNQKAEQDIDTNTLIARSGIRSLDTSLRRG